MSDLGIIDLYEKKIEKNSVKEFLDKTDSTLKVEVDKKKTLQDTEWIDVIELTIPYIDNIFRKPNRFIINEEELVKIEQAKKITIETIKHLSKNTNFIQTVDKETGDVTPSKLLNVRKEESYDTYENRLIYTLVQNTKVFIKKKKQELDEIQNADTKQEPNKDTKVLEYNATSKVKDENINVNLQLNSNLDSDGNVKEKVIEILGKISELENKISMLSNSEVYKIIDKQHITLVKEPIRKTNVVLKNVNFQYAMKLWSYLKDNYDGDLTEEAENRNYSDNGELKQFIDETFLLQYLAMKTLDEDKQENEITNQEIKDTMIEQMIERIIDMDTNITGQELNDLIAMKYEVIKYKKLEVIKSIQKIFKKHMDKYIDKVQKRRG